MSKAFDTIDHEILLHKLNNYGIRGIPLQLIKSYLSNRYQLTSVNSYEFDPSCIISGVPQGSILGPLLFLIYVNDIPNSSKLLNFILFADDTNIVYSHKDKHLLFNILNIELVKVSNWFKLNKLSLNITKTNYIIFKKAKKVKFNHDLYIDKNKIVRVTETKFLGITIDSNLYWKPHINRLSNVISRNIGMMNKLTLYFPSHILLTLYNTLVLPYLAYCNIGN